MTGLTARSIVRLCGAAFCLLAHAAAAGIAWIHVDFNWFMIEPARGVYDWTTTDAVVSEARARGLNVYATLAYTPTWANGGQGINVPPTDAGDWYRFVSTTVRRYRDRVKHWGMWNEPNLEGFFAGTLEQYLQAILWVGAQAVRAADPHGYVLGPELAMLGSWERWLFVVLEQADDVIDIVTQHAYAETGTQVLIEMLTPRVIMLVTGTEAKEPWLTETGWDTREVSEEAQAASYTQVLAGVEASGWLGKVFFSELVDDPAIAAEYGMLHSDLTPKPAYDAYQRHIASQATAAAERQ
jgi:hypothetical protein